uniref:Variant surface glycoprotein (VSG) n=1 Tax=Trypanosoma brucei brucei (strain 927/4 GUTat10.1) TaxID=185431 RepID=Q4FKI2_TRYB2|nr:hypothetical protein Tb11.0110 [Trypanosoma brucei brucei TREU927]
MVKQMNVQLAVLAATITVAATGIHDNLHKVDSPFVATDYLLGIASRAQSKLEQQLTAASNTLSLAQRIKIAAAAQATSSHIGAQLLATAVEKKATEALSAATRAYAAIINGVSAASQLAGTQDLLFELAKLNLPDKSASTDTTFTGAGGKPLSPTLTTAPTGECTTGANKRADHQTQTDPDATKNAITVFSIQEKAASNQLGGALSVCAATSAGSPSTSNCKTWAVSVNNLKFVGGKLLELKENKLTRKRETDDDYAAKTGHQGKMPSEKTIRDLLKKIKAMKNAAATLTQTSPITDLKLISEAQEIKAAMARALKGEKGSYTDGKGKAEVDTLLNKRMVKIKKL